jgi:hypothetical protein
MAYSSASDIQALIKWVVFSTSSKVTLAELDNYISDADAFINSKLERVYVVPITHLNDIEILKYISARFAACEVAQVLILQAGGKIPDIVTQWRKDATERLALILDLTIDLPNTTKLVSSNGLYSYTYNGNEENDYEDTPPIWNMSKDEW